MCLRLLRIPNPRWCLGCSNSAAKKLAVSTKVFVPETILTFLGGGPSSRFTSSCQRAFILYVMMFQTHGRGDTSGNDPWIMRVRQERHFGVHRFQQLRGAARQSGWPISLQVTMRFEFAMLHAPPCHCQLRCVNKIWSSPSFQGHTSERAKRDGSENGCNSPTLASVVSTCIVRRGTTQERAANVPWCIII